MGPNVTTTSVIWVHADALSAGNPAFLAYPDAPAIFVFDDVVLDGYQISLKRILFMYECLLEMPVEIYRGDVAECVVAFARRHEATGIATVNTPSPRFHHIVEEIGRDLPVEMLFERPLVTTPESTDLGRFTRFWKKAERSALLLGEVPAPSPVQNLSLPGLD